MQRSVWRHFAVLLCLALLFPVARIASSLHDHAPTMTWGMILWSAILESPRELFKLVAVIPAIAVATGYSGWRATRSALGVVCAALAIMLVIDMWIAPAADRETARIATAGVVQSPSAPGAIVSPMGPIDSLGVLRTGAKLLRERPSGIDEHLRSYPPGHPRVVAASVIEESALFLLPFILAGIILGTTAWMRARVIFRSVRDEVTARWFLAWILAPAAWALIGTWSGRYNYEILFRRGSIWLPLVPYLPFLILGALGWRASRRARELVDPFPQQLPRGLQPVGQGNER